MMYSRARPVAAHSVHMQNARSVFEPRGEQRARRRAERGVTVQALANELGFMYSTLGTALQTRAVPSLRLRQLLTNWVHRAPEVASEPVATFRPNGAGHTGNDAGNGAEIR
jgi:hypothetical protein